MYIYIYKPLFLGGSFGEGSSDSLVDDCISPIYPQYSSHICWYYTRTLSTSPHPWRNAEHGALLVFHEMIPTIEIRKSNSHLYPNPLRDALLYKQQRFEESRTTKGPPSKLRAKETLHPLFTKIFDQPGTLNSASRPA